MDLFSPAIVAEFSADFPGAFPVGLKTRQVPSLGGYRISGEGDGRMIEYELPTDAFRALANILGEPEFGPVRIREERRMIRSLGVMLDASRNAVPTVAALKYWLRRFALMGINHVQLYTEDTYFIEGEPFFGYARGAYSIAELREVDAYAATLGIELIPCIQTLGHLEQIFRWPAYRELMDVPGVLLCDEPATYRLIERMLDTLASCFRSRRIHIGMDEAHGVGRGKYRRLHGDRRTFDVINEHLEKVTVLCRERGWAPMIWSDMYFRAGSPHEQYYDRASSIPPDVASSIPPDVQLVYWDYYHTASDFYEEWIRRHLALGKKPVFAAGIWTWNRFWAQLPHSLVTVSAGMSACKKYEIEEVFVALWKDDGAECVPNSGLPGVQYFASAGYSTEKESDHLRRMVRVTTGHHLDEWMLPSLLDCQPDDPNPGESSSNLAKWILWHDPVLNFLDRHVPAGFAQACQVVAQKLQPLASTSMDFRMIHHFAAVVAGKAAIHSAIRELFQAGDVDGMRAMLKTTIPKTTEQLVSLRSMHREVWHQWYKPFGWEILELRYGGLISRMESLADLVGRFVEFPATEIPEFSFRSHAINDEDGCHLALQYKDASAPTVCR